MASFLIITVLLSSFTEKWYLDHGTVSNFGRLCIGDTDRDGNYELIFNTHEYGNGRDYICELHLPNTWQIDSFAYYMDNIVWELGDFDQDGLYDLMIQGYEDGTPAIPIVVVLESPDSFSYPTQEVWRDTVGGYAFGPTMSYDVDQDGVPEIIKCEGDPTPQGYEDFVIYESTGDNSYARLFAPVDTTGDGVYSTIAFGDFELDGRIEFVLGGEYYYIYESPAGNTYELIVSDYIYPPTIRDCFTVADADRDGRAEFVIKGFNHFFGYIRAFIFEATVDTVYRILDTMDFYTLYHPNYPGGFSEAGDVDGDSIPEIVLEAASYVYIIKSAGNDSFYVWQTLPGNNRGSSVRVTNDIDGNGYNEIVISGNNQTRIYEYEPGGIEEARSQRQEVRLDCYPNPFRNKLDIRYEIGDMRLEILQNPVCSTQTIKSETRYLQCFRSGRRSIGR